MTDGVGESYLWVQSTVHDGPAVDDGHIFLMYTQLENPASEGTYESFTCQATYSKSSLFAEMDNIVVRNYYGTGRFSETATSDAEDEGDSQEGRQQQGFFDINFEDLVDDQNAVWRADTVNQYSSFRSKYDGEMGTSSQTCTAIRAVDDTTNFMIKAGAYKFIQGFRIYENSQAMMKSNALYSGESTILEAKFENASTLSTSLLVAAMTIVAILSN